MKITLIVTGLLLGLLVVAAPFVWSDEDEHEYVNEYSRSSTGVALLNNPLYQEECGSCHMAYPPGLLPSPAWQAIMAGLDDHFGDNAELDNNTRQAIQAFLVDNSADKSAYRRSRHFAAGSKNGETPMRITQTPYFKDEHDEIPARLVTDNEAVRSFSHCNACHRKAEQASFREGDIVIPGYGRWDD